MRKILSGILVILTFLISCENKPGIEGLWAVQSVAIEDQKMTPNARWIRFNSDSTQESGNGWFQHSKGTWTYDAKNQRLRINDENGLVDPNEAFKVTLNGEEMIWQRTEDGQPVQVNLTRTEKLPTTYGDQVLGLWKLETAQGKGDFFSESVGSSDYLFLRWDKKFVAGTKKGKAFGIYNTHGHKPELELIPYEKGMDRSFWRVEYGENAISLTLLNSDSTVSRSFKRINDFPK